MDSVSASTTNAATGERPKPIMSKPVRIHELLGLPKSTGKTTEKPRSEPVRPKYLLEAMRSCERQTTNSSAWRKTIAPGTAGKVRRQLHLEPSDQPLLDKATTIGESQSKGDSQSMCLLGNVNSERKPIRLGLSKSDGKAKTNHQRMQPVRPKYLLESWEKSQSVKKKGQTAMVHGPRTTNARRKLYSGCPSPAPPKNVARKSLAANKFQETDKTPLKAEKVVKTNLEKSAKVAATAAQKRSRKSCLLPPNSIRDQHIGKKTKETIVEESPSTLSPPANPVVEEKTDINVENAREIREITTIPEALSTPRIPRVAASINPPCDRNYEISESAQPRKNQKNLMWLRDNLKDRIRVIEEELVSMRQMLKVTEDMIENNTESEEKSLQANTENCILAKTPKIVIENVKENEQSEAEVATDEPNEMFEEQRETNCDESLSADPEDDKENEESEAKVTTDEPQQNSEEQRETNCDENLSADPENDKENIPSMDDEAPNDEQSESGGKPRRRSARLAAVEAARSPNNSDDSFTIFESELNITHAKTKSPTPLTCTSAKRNKPDMRSKRSIREYMLIKSSAKFLQTPDQKGLPTPRADRAGTPAERRAVQRALSRQLLNQLHDLYDDSPE